MTPRATTAVLLAGAVVACAPALDPGVPRGYLGRGTPVQAGVPSSRLGGDTWQLVLGRTRVTRPLCDDLNCRRRALLALLRRAADAGVRAALIAPEDSDLLSASDALALEARLGLLPLATESLSDPDAPEVLVLRPEPGPAPAPGGSWRDRLQQAADEGAALILRHPCAQTAARRARLDDPALLDLLDAVEIDGPAHVDPACARALWQRWLRQGRSLVGLGAGAPRPLLDDGAPHHLDLVRTADPSAGGLVRALLAGRVQVLRDPATRPRLQLEADLDGDGRSDEVQQGDRLTLLDDVVELQIRVVGGRGCELVLYTEVADGPVERLPVDDRDQVLAVRYPVPAQGSGFVRAELHRGGDLLVVSNPLFVTRARLRAPGS